MANIQPWVTKTPTGGTRSNIFPAIISRLAAWGQDSHPAYLDDTYDVGMFATKTPIKPLPMAPSHVSTETTFPVTQQRAKVPDLTSAEMVKQAQAAVPNFGRSRSQIDRWTPEQVEANYQQGLQERLAQQDEIIGANARRDAELLRTSRERELQGLAKQASALPVPTWAIANPNAPGAREAIASYNAATQGIQTQYDALKGVLGYGQEARKQEGKEREISQEGTYKKALGEQALATAGRTKAEIPFLGQKYKADIGESVAREGLTKAQAELYSAQAKSQPAIAAARVGQAKADQLKAMQSKSKDNPVLGAILKQAETGMLTIPAIMKLRQTYPEYADDLDALALMQVQN